MNLSYCCCTFVKNTERSGAGENETSRLLFSRHVLLSQLVFDELFFRVRVLFDDLTPSLVGDIQAPRHVCRYCSELVFGELFFQVRVLFDDLFQVWLAIFKAPPPRQVCRYCRGRWPGRQSHNAGNRRLSGAEGWCCNKVIVRVSRLVELAQAFVRRRWH